MLLLGLISGIGSKIVIVNLCGWKEVIFGVPTLKRTDIFNSSIHLVVMAMSRIRRGQSFDIFK